MLTIRDEQMREFEKLQRRIFAEDTVQFIKTTHADACARFGEDALRSMVAQALRKAREYHLTAQTDILRYINVMYTLGCDFDADPQYPWAREIMSHPRLRPGSKMNRLVARTLDHLRALEAGK
jgi:hypothetical protein